MDAIQKVNKQFQQESSKQVYIIYSFVAVVCWQQYGWRKERIDRLFKLSQEVWNECGEYGTEKSMLEMLEEETGIEIAMPNKKSYHEYAYLAAAAWDRKPPTKMQLIYIRQQQMEWLPAMLLACFAIALHRKYKWADGRIGQFVGYVQQIRADNKNEVKAAFKLLEQQTGLTEDYIRGKTTNA